MLIGSSKVKRATRFGKVTIFYSYLPFMVASHNRTNPIIHSYGGKAGVHLNLTRHMCITPILERHLTHKLLISSKLSTMSMQLSSHVGISIKQRRYSTRHRPIGSTPICAPTLDTPHELCSLFIDLDCNVVIVRHMYVPIK
jgi:hypothetical protein